MVRSDRAWKRYRPAFVLGCSTQLRLFLPILLLSCGGSLPLPAQTAPPVEAFVEVPYPPPAALSEMIPERPASDTVWRDGGWVWRGRYYVWERGGWVRPGDLRFAPWRLRYQPDGQAMFAPGVWVNPRGEMVRRPPLIKPALTPPNEGTAEFQTGR
jgi:hypothetical protein